MAMTSSKLKQPDLSIVIPAYHEEHRIGRTLEELASFLKHDGFFAQKEVEVIVVTADTADRTQEIVAAKQTLFTRFELLKPGPKVGKGRDVQVGMLKATGKAILYMDADLATPLHHLEEFYKFYELGTDVIVATRGIRRHGSSKLRIVISTVGNVLFRLAGGVWIEDSQCGFKMFSAAAAQQCFTKLKIMGWGFDMEILTIAKINHLSVKPVRVDDWESVPNGTFERRFIRNNLGALSDLAVIFSRRLRGYYKSGRTQKGLVT
ncbi:MAG TPA: glycosyltransferase [Patescibacteria group bacterium]|nr:glycosyltransferase [Patescibacteria group bacterium]